MALIFNASTTRALLSAVAPFAALPGGYLTFPIIEPADLHPTPRQPAADPIVALPPLHAIPEYEEIELHALGSTGLQQRRARPRVWSEVGGTVLDDSAMPIMLDAAPAAATTATTTGYAPRPRAESAPRSRTRSFTARLAALSRGAPQPGRAAPAGEGNAVLEGIKAARASFASRTRRALNSVFGPALDIPNRGEYVRLRGRH